MAVMKSNKRNNNNKKDILNEDIVNKAYSKSDKDCTSLYLSELGKAPLLNKADELVLARQIKKGCDKSFAKMVASNLRLVVKMARPYTRTGMPLIDLISEGNIGLMQAVKRFDPDKGFRLATYAMWWIRAAIQEYILHSWSLVKIGTTAAQKKLFFNLRKIKNELRLINEGDLRPEHVKEISKRLPPFIIEANALVS